jgi:cation diffusion facilitator family transporter
MDIRVKYGLFSVVVIIFQSIIKITGVIVTGSLSFLSESVDTIIDIFFVSLTIFSLYQSTKPPDLEHMWGHSRIDSVSALIQGIFLISIYFFLIINAIEAILTSSYTIMNPDFGLIVLIVSFVFNIIFSRILIWKGKSNNSLALQAQGLNLFQDSLRAIIVIMSFVFAYFFNLVYLDPYFSIILSIIIIISAIKLAREGIQNLIDVNPIDELVIEEIRLSIFNLEHVNGVEEIKLRKSGGNNLYLIIRISVEDHISVNHANEITQTIRTMVSRYFPDFSVETYIEMNPIGGEESLGEGIINLLHSIMVDFPEIIKCKDLNVFQIKREYFVSLTIIIDESLTLEEAHKIITNFEENVKTEVPEVKRVISHIESERKTIEIKPKEFVCEMVSGEEKLKIRNRLREVLKEDNNAKGFHGMEFWKASDSCILELHVFYDGSKKVSEIHEYSTQLELEIRKNMKIQNLGEIIIHSEPVEGRTDGEIF